MTAFKWSGSKVGVLAAMLSLACVLGGMSATPAANSPGAQEKKAEKHPLNIEDGMYAESCSCRPPCPCELTGVEMHCVGVGAYELKKATYNGKDISGTKMAYALDLDEKNGWVHVYVDQKDAAKHDDAVAFAKAALSAFGNITMTKDASISITQEDSHYKVSVDDGKVMRFETEPVMGGDKKTPITHTNTYDALNPTFYQGKSVSVHYSGGGKQITLEKGRNCYFNNAMKSKGEV